MIVILALIGVGGCGKTIRYSATEQLVLSDAVDRSVQSIDFSPLAGLDCYLDTQFLSTGKNSTLVNQDYVTSSLRNQLLAAGCRLVEDKDDSQVVLEPRVGTLGTDKHEVTYGLPSSSALSQAAALVPTAPAIPTIPEIAFAKRDQQTAAAKIAVFAYDRESGDPYWQSGLSTARSSARDAWLFGVGPFQSGKIYEEPRFAADRLRLPLAREVPNDESRQTVSIDREYVFSRPVPTVPVPDGEPPKGDDRTADADGKENDSKSK